MLASDFAEKCKAVALDVPTIYKRGGWGQYDKRTGRFQFDCVCFVKSMIDNFRADKTKPYGGATYGKPCPDVNNDVQAMLRKHCVDISSDMSNIMPGEYLCYWDYSHCGIYIGDGQVVECTYRWKDGVQITKIDQPERKSLWGFHGKLWEWMDYNYRPSVIWAVQTGAYKSFANAKKYMKEGQHLFDVRPYYKAAYVFDDEEVAKKNLQTIRDKVCKDAFVTNYEGSALII